MKSHRLSGKRGRRLTFVALGTAVLLLVSAPAVWAMYKPTESNSRPSSPKQVAHEDEWSPPYWWRKHRKHKKPRPRPTPSKTATPTPPPTPTATVTPTPTAPPSTPAPTKPPTVPANCAKDPWSTLAACKWPGPGSAGVADKSMLAEINGDHEVTKDGAVLENKKINGRLRIRAKDVTVRNVFVNVVNANGENGSTGIHIGTGASATIDRVSIWGTNAAGNLGTGQCIIHQGLNVTVKNSDISGCTDGFFTWKQQPTSTEGDNWTFENNYVHDMNDKVNQDGAANTGHIDGLQTVTSHHGVVRHNVFDIGGNSTSAIAVWNAHGDTSDIAIDDNLIAGGGAAVYVHDYHPSEKNPVGGYTVTNVRVTNNKFSTRYFPCVGQYFIWFARPQYPQGGGPTDGWNRSGNVVIETGFNADNGNPTVDGRLCT